MRERCCQILSSKNQRNILSQKKKQKTNAQNCLLSFQKWLLRNAYQQQHSRDLGGLRNTCEPNIGKRRYWMLALQKTTTDITDSVISFDCFLLFCFSLSPIHLFN